MKLKLHLTLCAVILLSVYLKAQEIDPNNGLKHIMTPAEAALKDRIALGFVETDPPTGVIRNVEEFGNNDGVLVRYPFGIPISLIKELAKNAKVVTIVKNASQQATVTTQYQNNGVNLNNCSFLLAESDSYWTRDYGPWYVTYGDKQTGIVDFPYNRPRPNDDEIPKKLAIMQGIQTFGMRVIHTGGNYMTNGLDQASSTTLVWEENPTQTHEQIAQKFNDYLGISNYIVAEDPNGTYIDHIDCWGKFLAPDKVLIRKVPTNHPQYAEIEATANLYAQTISSYGTPYRVFRVNTPNNEPYTNSFILKDKVCVPLMGTANDAAALNAYQQAMPGYQIKGFLGSQSTPWESTDALHCRTHEIADFGQLFISHIPLHDSLEQTGYFPIQADITAFSSQNIYPDSVFTIYSVNNSPFDTLVMTHTAGNTYAAYIPPQMEGSAIAYYIQAKDASGRTSNHPFIGQADPHRFFVKHATSPDVIVLPDSLLFLTSNEAINGKKTYVANFSQHDITINNITQEGNSLPWIIDPYPFEMPYTLASGDSLSLNVVFRNPGDKFSEYACDSLFVTTPISTHEVKICINPLLLETNFGIKASKLNVYPNPMRTYTTFEYELVQSEYVQIDIYSSLGQHIATLEQDVKTQGKHSLRWQPSISLPSGLYMYQVKIGNSVNKGRLSIVP